VLLIRTHLAASDEYLAYAWLYGQNALPESAVVDRHVPPSQYALTFRADIMFDDVFTRAPLDIVARQEHHADPVIAGRWQGNIEFRTPASEKHVRDLDQDAGTVASQRIGTYRATMSEVL
jgi:hypothetical protein